MNLSGFIDQFKEAIAKRVVESYSPLYRPSENGPNLPRLLRTPMGGQEDAIKGAVLSLRAHRGTIVVGEMGTGKTFIGGGAAAHAAGFRRILVLCPPHLTRKWKREVEETVPQARAAIVTSITIRQRASLRNLIEAIPEADWTPIPYWMDGAADVAETAYTPFQSEPDAAPVRLIVRRVKPTPGSQLALFASYSYHGFITDRDGDTLELEADHRRHAEVENAIRDLKYGVGLNHLPSGRFAANAAWLAVQVLAHNLARWAARIGLGEQLVTTKTLRRRFFSMAGRLTRSARRLTLHLPRGWPWAEQATLALARLRAIPLPA